MLFEKKLLTAESLKAYARDLKVDTAKFDACLDSGQMKSVISEHAAEAQSLVLQGTPTVLINGRLLSGDLNYQTLRTAIAEELSAAGVTTQASTRAGRSER